jgi:hypothetical protein
MVEVEPKEGEPRLRLFESLEELRRETGETHTHGYFDPATNTIVATLDSCAHELGHWKDYQSGRMRMVQPALDGLERAQSRMRNEIVAILFAAQKVTPGPQLLDYERNFCDWFLFMLKKQKFSDFMRPEVLSKTFSAWSFSEIQDFSEWVVKEHHDWFERLEFIFRHYLQDTHVALTYSVK